MSKADEKALREVCSFLERQKLEFTSEEEQNCDKLTVRTGAHLAYVSVYNSGKIVIGGKDSPLKSLLLQMKTALEAGQAMPGQPLPFEIERFPQTLTERVPNIDPVIVRFIDEAIRCLKADALLSAAFMLGAASEKAVALLVQSFGESILDQQNRDGFASRINNRTISKRYGEFASCYAGCKSKPTEPALAQDLDILIGGTFQFCRITRNEVGHPQIVPDLDRGVIVANLGHFIVYVERVYRLMDHFRQIGVIL
jgi:hypothetical protein